MRAHGGDRQGFLEEFGKEPIDFSANVNPLGVPEGVRRAIVDAAASADAYPDPRCGRLRAALSAKLKLPPEWILCGNGAADLIFRIVYALHPKRALLPAPTFMEYGQALRAAGCAAQYHMLSAGNAFRMDDSILKNIVPGIGMLFLCNPNNPTGALLSKGLLARVAARCRECGVWLVVDECFLSFTRAPGQESAKTLLEGNPRLLVLDAFTKIYGMAGVRLGYLMCRDAKTLEGIDLAGQPWAVSSLAQAAGLAALAQDGYVKKTLKLLAGERPFLRDGLAALGLRVFEPEANYIFFQAKDWQLKNSLARRGVAVRGCGNYVGLDDTYYRVAIRTRMENEILLAAMAECL